MSTCKDCMFYKSGSEWSGVCRRYPPVYLAAVYYETGLAWAQAATDADDWCGEFKPEPEAQQAFERGVMSAAGV